MKIGLVCPYHMFRGGGVQECVLALQAELTSRGHDARIITPQPRDYKGPAPDGMIMLGASTTVKAFFNTQTQVSAAVDLDAIDDMVSREKFDLLHFHEPWVPVLSRQLLTRSDTVNVATSHAKIPDRFTSKTVVNVFVPYTRALLKYIDAYSAVSDPAAEYIRGLTNDPVRIIPNGIDIAKYARTSPVTSHRMRTILYIGRLEKRKGVKYLLQAYALLAKEHDDVQLYLAGTGPEERKLREMVSEYDIPRVTFLGYVSDEEKIRLFHRADLFTSPARYGESFGIVLLEAMAAGVPLVAGDNDGYVSVMKGRGAVSVVDVYNTDDFARRLELLLNDAPLRKLWLDWAHEYVKQYDYKNVVDQYVDLYEQAIKHHERTRR